MGIFILTAIGLMGWAAVFVVAAALLVLWYVVERIRQALFERDEPASTRDGREW